MNVVTGSTDEISHDHIQTLTGGEGVAGRGKQGTRFIQVQLQGYSESQSGGFAGAIGFIASDLGKQLTVEVGLFVGFDLAHTPLFDQARQRWGELLIKVAIEIINATEVGVTSVKPRTLLAKILGLGCLEDLLLVDE